MHVPRRSLSGGRSRNAYIALGSYYSSLAALYDREVCGCVRTALMDVIGATYVLSPFETKPTLSRGSATGRNRLP